MRYSVERVEWKDSHEVVSELLSHGFPTAPAARYARLHEANPAGPGALWLARTDDGRPIGTAAIHRRRILVDGRAYRAGQAADFAVEPSARAFGPAIALQRAVVSACDSGEFAFLYGFPNRPARAVFERVGYRFGASRRLARPLRTRPYLERTRRVASIAPFLAAPLDLAIRLLSRETYRGTPRGTRLERLEAFDESFDLFWARVRGQYPVVADRDSQYMNWRYRGWPSRHYDFAVLRRGADIVATIVWYRADDVVYVSELLALDAGCFDALLVAFLRAQRRAGACAVSLILLGDERVVARLARYGFVVRDVERTMMVYLPSPSPVAGAVDPVDRWCLFEGDVL